MKTTNHEIHRKLRHLNVNTDILSIQAKLNERTEVEVSLDETTEQELIVTLSYGGTTEFFDVGSLMEGLGPADTRDFMLALVEHFLSDAGHTYRIDYSIFPRTVRFETYLGRIFRNAENIRRKDITVWSKYKLPSIYIGAGVFVVWFLFY